jgi:P4 family phage/plasmid primase-like protien
VTLSDIHKAELNGSRITQELIEARGYRTVEVSERDELREMGVPLWAIRSDDAFPGLLIPMYRSSGEQTSFQFKPAVPQLPPGKDKAQKYASATGKPATIDVPPCLGDSIRDTKQALWINEGVKKADCLASRGTVAVALSGVWNWRNKSGTLGDWEDIPLKDRNVVICFDSDAREKRPVMLAMKRLGEWLKSKGAATVFYLIIPAELNGVPVKGVDDYFAAGGERDALFEAAVTQLPTDGAKDAAFSDSFLTDAVCDERLSGRFLWAAGLGWMHYDGARWAESSDVELTEEIRQWAIDRWQAVLTEQRNDPNRDLKSQVEGWRSVLGSGRLRALGGLAKGPLLCDPAKFDAHPDLLNCPNGVVDLRTGELIPPSPDHLMTKMTGVDYVAGWTDPDFTQALRALPEDMHDWYQLRIGQAFTGYMTPDDVLVVQQGGGENGKSTINVPLRTAAGSYFVMVSHRVLTGSADQHPTELMDFRGARYAMMEETPEARRLDPQHLRTTVGTPEITARKIRQDSVTFYATHSMFVNTNFKPQVTESDHGTWRRLALVRFPYTFRKSQEDVTGPLDILGDPELRERCKSPSVARAALSWAVAGSVRWYANKSVFGIKPERVEHDTREWREDGDQILAFIGDRLVFGADEQTPCVDLHREFNAWLVPQGNKEWSAVLFSQRFSMHSEVQQRRVDRHTVKINGKATKVWRQVGIARGGNGDKADPFEGPVTSVTSPMVNREVESLPRVNNSRSNHGNPQVGPGVSGESPVCPPEQRALSTPLPEEPHGFIPFDIETGNADDLFATDYGTFVKLVGVGDHVVEAAGAGPLSLMERRPLVGVNNFFFDSIAMDRHHNIPVEQTIIGGRDLRIAAFQNDPPTSYQTSSGPGFKSYSMDALSERYLGRPGKSGLGAALAKEYGGWDHIPASDPRYVEYLREDLAVTAELDAAIPYDPYEEREARVCAVTARATLNGFKVDVSGLHKRAEELAARADAGRTMLAVEHGFPLTNMAGKEAAAPQRTKQGKAAFEQALGALGFPVSSWPRGKDGALSLSKETMAYALNHAEQHVPAAVPVIEAVQGMNGIRNNAANVLRHVHSGRVHPAFLPFQATGRWSILDPGLTVLKKGVQDSERYFLTADDDEVLVSIDLDQIDIRCVAAHSQDENLIAILNDPSRDFHSEISDMAFGDHEGTHRHAAKSLDLGWLYGRGIKGMVENTPGVTMDAAASVDQSMRSRFGRVLRWQSEVRALGEVGVLLDNGFGRKLRVDPDRAYTQSPAMLGQSTTRDLIAEGLLTLAATAPEILPMLRVIVHDEIVLSVPKKDREEIARIAQAAMSRMWAPAGASRPVSITAGQGKPFVFGERWGQLYEK